MLGWSPFEAPFVRLSLKLIGKMPASPQDIHEPTLTPLTLQPMAERPQKFTAPDITLDGTQSLLSKKSQANKQTNKTEEEQEAGEARVSRCLYLVTGCQVPGFPSKKLIAAQSASC